MVGTSFLCACGSFITQTFKSVLKDLMNQFGMRPGIDYVDNLKDNEPSTDFVALSKEADELIIGLMEGKIIAINGHVRKSRNGTEYQVKAHISTDGSEFINGYTVFSQRKLYLRVQIFSK